MRCGTLYGRLSGSCWVTRGAMTTNIAKSFWQLTLGGERSMLLLMNRKLGVGFWSVILLAFAISIHAQDYAPPPAPSGQMLTPAQLDQALGPIALYPDPLVAQLLPACMQPAQIAVAYSYISSGGDPNGIDQQNWDSTVKAVVRYPDVLKMLNDNMAWATELGQAYLNQPTDVMNSIQRLRAQAQQLGNLQNLPQDNVVSDEGQIEILPSDPDMIYVPTYDPSLVFYTPCYGRPFITFGVGFRIGLWLDHDFDWHGRRLIAWDHAHPRPANWWREAPAARRTVIARAPVWHPPARVVTHTTVYGRGDRGYAPPQREVKPVARPVETRPAPRPVEVHPAPRPVEHPAPARPVETHPTPARPAEVHAAPARPTVFPNETTRETREASSRGATSRGVSRPAPAPAPSHAPSGGGGGGGGNRKH